MAQARGISDPLGTCSSFIEIKNNMQWNQKDRIKNVYQQTNVHHAALF